MNRNPIQTSDFTKAVILRESLRQGGKKGVPVSMGDVVYQYAKKLNKKHKFIVEDK